MPALSCTLWSLQPRGKFEAHNRFVAVTFYIMSLSDLTLLLLFRPMRPKEEDGIDYIFVSKKQFEAWINDDKLLEHALVYGEYKGILRSQIAHALDNKQDVVLRLDVQGAATMRRLIPDAVSIFLVSMSVLTSSVTSCL